MMDISPQIIAISTFQFNVNCIITRSKEEEIAADFPRRLLKDQRGYLLATGSALKQREPC